MKKKVKILLSFLLVTILIFQFSGTVGVNALENSINFNQNSLNENESNVNVTNEKNTDSVINGTEENSAKSSVDAKKGDLTAEELKTAVLDEADIPEVIIKKDAKEKGHVNRLYEQEENLNTVLFQNRDGSKTMYYYDEPVKYVDENGKVKDKSNKLVKSDNEGYALENKANDVKTLFPIDLMKKGIKLQTHNTDIELSPIAESYATITYSDDVVTYHDVFGRGIDLQYKPLFSGFKEDIIIEKYTGQNKFSFVLKTNGLQLVEEKGQYFLVDPLTGKKSVTLGELIIYDSSNGAEKNKENVKAYNHYINAETIKEDHEYIITIVVDETYLTDPDTVYPVIVDPSSYTYNYTYIDDAVIYSGVGCSNRNFYNYSQAFIGHYIQSGVDYGVGRMLVNFPGVYNSSIFTTNIRNSSQIIDAEFSIYQETATTGTATISAYLFTGPSWNESTVTCSSANWDSLGWWLDSETYNNGDRGYRNYNLTQAFKRWKEDPSSQRGIILKNDDEINPNKCKMLTTIEHPNTVTTLSLTYTEVPATTQTSGIISGHSYYIQNVLYDDYLDIINYGTTPYTRLIQYPLHGGPNQKFTLYYAGNGEYKIFPNHTSGMVLTASPSNEVYIDYDYNYDSQRWYIVKEGASSYTFINKDNQDRKLASISSTDSQYVNLQSTNTGTLWYIGGDNITISLNAYNAGIRAGKYYGKYYYDYTIPINNFFNSEVDLCSYHPMFSWSQYCEWCANQPLYYEPSLLEWEGMKLGTFIWFYNQVKSGAIWDIKLQNRWEENLDPYAQYLGLSEPFLFRGILTTAEGIGNINYGYVGRAVGFGLTTLYWGGGVAKQGSINNSAVNTPPLYGDDQDDHDNITLGYNLFNSDYPDYRAVGYDGIPIEQGILAWIVDNLI